jgi:hypothetical protein
MMMWPKSTWVYDLGVEGAAKLYWCLVAILH